MSLKMETMADQMAEKDNKIVGLESQIQSMQHSLMHLLDDLHKSKYLYLSSLYDLIDEYMRK